VDGANVRLSWRSGATAGTRVFYRILRSDQKSPPLACAGRLRNSADNCILILQAPATTRTTSFVDRPGRGTWTYRIGVSANWLNDPRYGDIYVVSPPVIATVP
jgi:hypothetical protein